MILQESEKLHPGMTVVNVETAEITAIIALAMHGIMATVKSDPKGGVVGFIMIKEVFNRNKQKIKEFSDSMGARGERKGLFEEMQRMISSSCKILRIPEE